MTEPLLSNDYSSQASSKLNQPNIQLESLQKQIGSYTSQTATKPSGQKNVINLLDQDAKAELYRGNQTYQDNHLQSIQRYQQRIKQEPTPQMVDDPQYFRKAFIEFIQLQENDPSNSYKGDDLLRQTNPEKATVGLEQLFGKEGAHLYKLALEEETYSNEFRDAVLEKSTKHFEGEEWAERPVVIVAGPSASGKSFAAEGVVKAASISLQKKGGNNLDGNYVVSVDGGVPREVSQIRKLAIQHANNQGYTGIKDLHKNSAVLNKVKTSIQEAAFKTPNLGIVIPETFSFWVNPFDKVHKLIPRILNLDSTKLIFSRIAGTDDKKFQEVVGYQGSRRAWKTDNFVKEALDLNKADLSESKAYGASGFRLGDFGSKQAEEWYNKNVPEKNKLIIKNDLRLYKEDLNKAGDWVPAVQGDKDVQLISERVFNQWKAAKKHNSTQVSLPEYNKANRKLIILDHYKIALDMAIDKLDQRIASSKTYEKQLALTHIKDSLKEEPTIQQLNKVELLIDNKLNNGPFNKNGKSKKVLTEINGILKELHARLLSTSSLKQNVGSTTAPELPPNSKKAAIPYATSSSISQEEVVKSSTTVRPGEVVPSSTTLPAFDRTNFAEVTGKILEDQNLAKPQAPEQPESQVENESKSKSKPSNGP